MILTFYSKYTLPSTIFGLSLHASFPNIFFTMFAKFLVVALSVLATVSSEAFAKPIARPAPVTKELARRTFSPPSFNNYLGLSSMSNFDNFFGVNNFNEVFNEQTIIEQQTEVVCSSVEIEIVQQRLSILVEVAKQIILEQVCEVEVQTIVLQQFTSVVSSFGSTIDRSNGHSQSYDSSIAGLLGSIHNSDGSVSNQNLGFSGKDIGSKSVSVGGSNWNDASSPESVSKAKNLAMEASNCTISSDNSTSINSTSLNSTSIDSNSSNSTSSNSTSSNSTSSY